MGRSLGPGRGVGDGEGEFGVFSPNYRGPGRDERGRRD